MITSLCFLAFSSCSVQQPSDTYNLLIGTYSTPGEEGSIYVYRFNADSGTVQLKNRLRVNSPSYLTVSKDLNNVYAVSEDSTTYVNAFSYEAKSGSLKLINRIPAGGRGPTYISVDSSKRYVFTANYGGGSLSALQIGENGGLEGEPYVIKHSGSGLIPGRQSHSHVHSVVLTPDNKFVVTQDLGTDKVYLYRFNPDSVQAPLVPAQQASITLPPGTGPRHLTFAPNGKYAYLISEISSVMMAFEYADDSLKLIQSLSTMPDGFTGTGNGADVHVSPDGRFLYGSNRGDLDDIVVYSIDQSTGKLTFVQRVSAEGAHARTFAIDPSGNYLVIANGRSNNLTIFKRDKQTGKLTSVGHINDITRPSCVKFTSAQ
jgi:6-phosphogluconolactonase